MTPMENTSQTITALELGEATLRRIWALTPEEGRQSLIDAGILLPNGNVADAYREVFRPSSEVEPLPDDEKSDG